MIRAFYYSKRLRRRVFKKYLTIRTFNKARRALLKRGIKLRRVFRKRGIRRYY